MVALFSVSSGRLLLRDRPLASVSAPGEKRMVDMLEEAEEEEDDDWVDPSSSRSRSSSPATRASSS